MKQQQDFVKRKSWLICFDSDGCVMDTMNSKHELCFGPCLVKQWQLEEWEAPILKRWNDINLFSSSRGINRFLGLNLMLHEIDAHYRTISGLQALTSWVEHTGELSEDGLKKVLEKQEIPILAQALSWSQAVNTQVSRLSDDRKLPFEAAQKGLEAAHWKADTAVVSSANYEAIKEEWEMHGLLDHIDVVLSQNDGSKKQCLSMIAKKGYSPQQILMVGDAPGDKSAAEANGVRFYPILVGLESQSWNYFLAEALPRFLQGLFDDEYQKRMNQSFEENLS